jgi:hypothetical protein
MKVVFGKSTWCNQPLDDPVVAELGKHLELDVAQRLDRAPARQALGQQPPQEQGGSSESSRRPRNFSIEPRILLDKAPIPFPACAQRKRIAEGHGCRLPRRPARRYPPV